MKKKKENKKIKEIRTLDKIEIEKMRQKILRNEMTQLTPEEIATTTQIDVDTLESELKKHKK